MCIRDSISAHAAGRCCCLWRRRRHGTNAAVRAVGAEVAGAVLRAAAAVITVAVACEAARVLTTNHSCAVRATGAAVTAIGSN
eukprot:3116019-Prymnesium_polylepis.1